MTSVDFLAFRVAGAYWHRPSLTGFVTTDVTTRLPQVVWVERAEVVAFFQHLIDNGLVSRMQDSYGRIARILIERGECQPQREML